MRQQIDDGLHTIEELDAHVSRVLRANFAHAQDRGRTRRKRHRRHRLLTREVAESSITLLRTTKAFCRCNSRLAPHRRHRSECRAARLGGSGSASVTPSYSISPMEGLRGRLGHEVEVVYSEGCPAHGSGRPVRGCFSHRLATGETADGLITEFFNNLKLDGAPAHRGVAQELNYAWGWASPARGVRRGYFGVRFSGEMTIPVEDTPAEMHLLYEAGGARVWINDSLVHDNWDPAEHGVFENRYGAFSALVPITHKPGRLFHSVSSFASSLRGQRCAWRDLRAKTEDCLRRPSTWHAAPTPSSSVPD